MNDLRKSPIHPLLLTNYTRTWFIEDGKEYYANMTAIYRVIFAEEEARILLRSYAMIGDIEPSRYAYPLMHFNNGMDIEVHGGTMNRNPSEYLPEAVIARFEHAVVARSWIGEMTSLSPIKHGMIVIWLEVRSPAF